MAEDTTDTRPSQKPQKADSEAPENEAEVTEGTAAVQDAEEQGKVEEARSSKESELQKNNDDDTAPPPLPNESLPPPLPSEAPPLPNTAPSQEDDGWEPIWEESAQAFYFYNRFTGTTTWDNPRVPTATSASTLPPPPGLSTTTASSSEPKPPATAEPTGYNPAIHGDYDPNAWYAQPSATDADASTTLLPGQQNSDPYAATAAFNRFTGRFQNADITPENFNDENKSRRQMNAFFDVDAAANSHDGRSLKAERSGKKLSKNELKTFKEKRKLKKEEKRRAWLRD